MKEFNDHTHSETESTCREEPNEKNGNHKKRPHDFRFKHSDIPKVAKCFFFCRVGGFNLFFFSECKYSTFEKTFLATLELLYVFLFLSSVWCCQTKSLSVVRTIAATFNSLTGFLSFVSRQNRTFRKRFTRLFFIRYCLMTAKIMIFFLLFLNSSERFDPI